MGIAARITTDAALLFLGDVATYRAEAGSLLDCYQHLRQAAHVGWLSLENVEGQTLRALGPDAGQPPEFIDQVRNNAVVHLSPARSRR